MAVIRLIMSDWLWPLCPGPQVMYDVYLYNLYSRIVRQSLPDWPLPRYSTASPILTEKKVFIWSNEAFKMFLKIKCKETYRAISREGMLKCLQIAYSPGLYWDWETLIQQFWFWPETNIIEISQQINYKLYLLCLRHTNILFFYWWTISKKRKPLMKGILDPVGTFQIVKQ